MGSGSSKSTQKTSGPKLQNRTFHSCFEYSLRAEKFANTDKEYEDFISTLTGNTMSSDFKLGKKKKDLISKVVYFNKTYTIGIILEITHQLQGLITNLLILGYLQENTCKLFQDSCKIITKCFVSKYKILDLSTDLNTKRVFSILKCTVELYHICKLFKEESVFLDGKWWGSISECRYISLIKRKIHKKCEAITENYEKSASEDEGTPSTSDLSCTINRKLLIEQNRLNTPELVKFKGEKQSEGFKDNEKGKKSTLIEIDKPYFGDNEKNSKDNDLKEEKLVLEKNIKINEISERMLKLKKKIDLNLDHIEEMPVNYECSSKRIDLIDATLEEMFEENPLIDSIKENNSDDKIPPNNSRHNSNTLNNKNQKKKKLSVISNVLSEITEIKKCLKENCHKNKNEKMSTYKEESTLENLEESMPSKHSMKNFSSHKKTIVKEKISSDPYQESIELSEFILTYLNKTYKNVITSNCSQE